MDLRRLLAFGSAVGIEIRGPRLEIAVARVRPQGIDVLGRTTLENFHERPAAEWGREYAAFVKRCGGAHLAVTVLLPRREVIVRQVAFPGIPRKELPAALALEIDSLHPYGEDDVAWAWAPLGSGAALVGIARRATLDRYQELFAGARIRVACFTFSASAIHAALRIGKREARDFLTVSEGAAGGYEFYGESRTRPLFSAEFDLPLERAATLAASELRLADGAAPEPLYALLPQPRSNPVENDLSRNALPYATALAGACPRLAPAANLLPAHLRATGSAAAYAPTAVLALLLLLLAGALAGFRAFDQRRYLARLRAEIARLEPEALRAAALDRQIDNIRSRTRLLDDFRLRAKKDLDAVNELTGLLAPPAWVHVLDLTRDGVVINGEAEQPAAFLKIIDASPYFENSDFSVQFARSPAPNNAETFRIHTRREAGR